MYQIVDAGPMRMDLHPVLVDRFVGGHLYGVAAIQESSRGSR